MVKNSFNFWYLSGITHYIINELKLFFFQANSSFKCFDRPAPNMLEIFLPALPKNVTDYSYFILISLPIIPILFFSKSPQSDHG